jgi:hypothetical protein
MASTQIRGTTQIQVGTIADAQIQAAAAIQTSKLADGAKFIKSDGTVPMLAGLQMGTGTPSAPAGTQPINQVTNPVNPQDAATKSYVDTSIANIATSSTTTLVATVGANITLSGTQTLDGVALSIGNKVLVKDQTSQATNGIYQVQSAAWTRDPSMASWNQVPGMIISVEQGTTMHDTVWLSTADPGGTMGTTAITFTQMPGPSDIIAGQGLTRSGQTLNVTCPDTSLTLATGAVNVKIDPARAITLVAVGIGINADGTTLVVTSNTLGVKPGLYMPIMGTGNRVTREVVGGAFPGTAYTLAHAPNPVGCEEVFLNGLLLQSGAGNDYTISGTAITMLTTTSSGDKLLANYWY